jgi:hypothetical protein
VRNPASGVAVGLVLATTVVLTRRVRGRGGAWELVLLASIWGCVASDELFCRDELDRTPQAFEVIEQAREGVPPSLTGVERGESSPSDSSQATRMRAIARAVCLFLVIGIVPPGRPESCKLRAVSLEVVEGPRS